MRNRIFKTILSLSCFAGLLLAAGSASAITDLGWWDNPGGAGDATAQLNFLNDTVLPAWNGANDPDLPAATYGTDNIDVPGELLTIDLDVSAYNYLKLKWDNKWQYYFIGDEAGELTFDSTAFNDNRQPQALSHYTFFSPREVPDGGLTVGLFGLGLVGVGLLRRRIS